MHHLPSKTTLFSFIVASSSTASRKPRSTHKQRNKQMPLRTTASMGHEDEAMHLHRDGIE